MKQNGRELSDSQVPSAPAPPPAPVAEIPLTMPRGLTCKAA